MFVRRLLLGFLLAACVNAQGLEKVETGTVKMVEDNYVKAKLSLDYEAPPRCVATPLDAPIIHAQIVKITLRTLEITTQEKTTATFSYRCQGFVRPIDLSHKVKGTLPLALQVDNSYDWLIEDHGVSIAWFNHNGDKKVHVEKGRLQDALKILQTMKDAKMRNIMVSQLQSDCVDLP